MSSWDVMMTFFSKIIDYYALNKLHKDRSLEFQFSTSQSIPDITEREFFYKTHPIEFSLNLHVSKKGYRIGTFESQSLIYSEDECNDYITGEAFINRNEEAPNVIFVHGWRADSCYCSIVA